MSTVTLYNEVGKEAGKTELSDAVFGMKPKSSLIHQVYVAIVANARQPWAHTKDRSDVRGGGKKPWKQKGTGRARHGSTRSPIWKGGGVTFGPRNERDYDQKVNRKMSKRATAMCLSAKVSAEKLFVLNTFLQNGKTKDMALLKDTFKSTKKSLLVVTAEKNETVMRAARNIQACDVVRAQDVNVVDLLHHQVVLIDASAVKALEKRLA